MSAEVGPVREEAERLVAAVLARFPPGASRGALQQDGERVQRLATAAGDVAVAVTALIRELARSPREPAPGTDGLREGFARFATGLVESAGVDLLGDPPAAPGASSGRSASYPRDVWRAATRTDPEGEASAGDDVGTRYEDPGRRPGDPASEPAASPPAGVTEPEPPAAPGPTATDAHGTGQRDTGPDDTGPERTGPERAGRQASGAKHGTVSTDTDEVERTDQGDAHDRS